MCARIEGTKRQGTVQFSKRSPAKGRIIVIAKDAKFPNDDEVARRNFIWNIGMTIQEHVSCLPRVAGGCFYNFLGYRHLSCLLKEC